MNNSYSPFNNINNTQKRNNPSSGSIGTYGSGDNGYDIDPANELYDMAKRINQGCNKNHCEFVNSDFDNRSLIQKSDSQEYNNEQSYLNNWKKLSTNSLIDYGSYEQFEGYNSDGSYISNLYDKIDNKNNKINKNSDVSSIESDTCNAQFIKQVLKKTNSGKKSKKSKEIDHVKKCKKCSHILSDLIKQSKQCRNPYDSDDDMDSMDYSSDDNLNSDSRSFSSLDSNSGSILNPVSKFALKDKEVLTHIKELKKLRSEYKYKNDMLNAVIQNLNHQNQQNHQNHQNQPNNSDNIIITRELFVVIIVGIVFFIIYDLIFRRRRT
jgi:hypothetical protein